MKSYAVLRVAKIKCLGQLGSVKSHNTRQQPKFHADNASPMMGGGVRRLQGSDDAVQAFKERLAETGAKPRKGAVLALEFIASASPEWFQAASQSDKSLWVEQTLGFLNKTVGGSDNVLAAHLHDDESTVHIHFVAVPLVQKKRRTAGRKAKSKAAQDKQNEGLSWALSAADIVGDKKKLESLQSNYALAVSSLGIRRGQPKSVTGAQHKSPAAYRADLAAHTQKTIANTEREVRVTTQAITTGLTMGFDAVDNEVLAYASTSDDEDERLVRGPNAPAGRGWKQLLYVIHPVAKAILQYAKAKGQLARKERVLTSREKDVEDDAAELVSMAGRLLSYRRSLGTKAVNDTEHIRNRASLTRDRSR